MPTEDQDPFERYKVVINHEEQYSIWPEEKDNALGWRDAGNAGTKKECLDYIEQVWTDMRPLSLRKKMEEMARNPPPPRPAPNPLPDGKSLVERLCEGSHPVEIRLRPDDSTQALKQCIDRGYVHVKFPQTKGGTELGVQLQADRSDWSQGDFERGAGTVRLVGELTLDFEKVRCTADIDLAMLSGTGHLERL